MVQFSAIAYSPRLVLWFARDRLLFHSLGAFVATFIYSLFTLAWVDRGGSGAVPLLSSVMVAIMLIASVLLFSRFMQRLSDLQITNVLHLTGDKGREVIREMFERPDRRHPASARALRRTRRSASPRAAIFRRIAHDPVLTRRFVVLPGSTGVRKLDLARSEVCS
jgi:uncharacterized membrane protein